MAFNIFWTTKGHLRMSQALHMIYNFIAYKLPHSQNMFKAVEKEMCKQKQLVWNQTKTHSDSKNVYANFKFDKITNYILIKNYCMPIPNFKLSPQITNCIPIQNLCMPVSNFIQITDLILIQNSCMPIPNLMQVPKSQITFWFKILVMQFQIWYKSPALMKSWLVVWDTA